MGQGREKKIKRKSNWWKRLSGEGKPKENGGEGVFRPLEFLMYVENVWMGQNQFSR